MKTQLQDLDFSLMHVGINADSPEASFALAELFSKAFGFAIRNGSSSCFAGGGIEIMKSRYLGQNGHIAIGTTDVTKAIAALEAQGFHMNSESYKYSNGELIAAYLQEDFGGFAVHLLKKG